ncbi:Hypothetical predicted protein [Lecanosticta acicola]|uniref:Uncharacterized protein n=1 Tax=Lecanosticta acicola TaxID=111012 RepID=A0AAI9EEJ7_9PEZI|nr:Hypothetical predicted protein [Lecanosticta acicola]
MNKGKQIEGAMPSTTKMHGRLLGIRAAKHHVRHHLDGAAQEYASRSNSTSIKNPADLLRPGDKGYMRALPVSTAFQGYQIPQSFFDDLEDARIAARHVNYQQAMDAILSAQRQLHQAYHDNVMVFINGAIQHQAVKQQRKSGSGVLDNEGDECGTGPSRRAGQPVRPVPHEQEEDQDNDDCFLTDSEMDGLGAEYVENDQLPGESSEDDQFEDELPEQDQDEEYGAYYDYGDQD